MAWGDFNATSLSNRDVNDTRVEATNTTFASPKLYTLLGNVFIFILFYLINQSSM